MKIRNDLVSIKIGQKQYDFKNLIFDEYLKRIISRQLDIENFNLLHHEFFMRNLLLKFDTPFENLDSSTVLHNQDFDIGLTKGATAEQEISDEGISIKYTYNAGPDFVVYDYSKGTASNNYINNYYGRQITAIGFNSSYRNDSSMTNSIPVCAILDTSNYNLYLQENQLFIVTRKDTITTDAKFYSKFPEIKGPAHLCPMGIEYNGDSWINNYYGILYSIGYGNHPDTMLTEELIGNEVRAIQDNTNLFIGPIINTDFANKLKYPNSNIYPNYKLYGAKDNYKYIILKYKVYRLEVDNLGETTYIDTNMYYHQVVPLNNYGSGNIEIKYERG